MMLSESSYSGYPFYGRDSFNRDVQVEARNFIGNEWIATGPGFVIQFHLQNEFHALSFYSK